MKTQKGSSVVVMSVLLAVTLAATQSSLAIQASAFGGRPDGLRAVTFTSEGPGSITVAFEAVAGRPEYSSAVILANDGLPDSGFQGNYVDGNIQGIVLGVTGDGHLPKAAAVMLWSGDKKWYSRFSISNQPGLRMLKHISLDRTADDWQPIGWGPLPGENLDQLWKQSLESVTALGLTVVPNSKEKEVYTFDGFRLVDQDGNETDPATLTPLQKALKERFRVTRLDEIDPEDAATDSDADGMTDLNEILAEYDADYYEKNLFAAEVVSVKPSGVLIKWACLKDQEYAVLRAGSLIGEFKAIGTATASETGYMNYLDAAAKGVGPFYYKILKLQ